ncbi:NifB/NifX family molybdenum-iron cluster-binding protein [Alkalibaculum bacchi]|nr:NifB/NifX family molybdenum-iron cluster-binding protein [Alkalibaculum bacchi]
MFSFKTEKNRISSHFGEAPIFMLFAFKPSEKVVEQVDFIANPYNSETKGKGILAAEFLIKKNIDILIV